MSQYPILLVPPTLDRSAVLGNSPVTPIWPEEPVPPTLPTYVQDPKLKDDMFGCSVVLVVYAVVVGLLMKSGLMFVGILPAFAILAIVWVFRSLPGWLEHESRKADFRNRNRVYESEMRQLPEKKRAYEEGRRRYDADMTEHELIQRFMSHRKEYARKTLSRTQHDFTFTKTVDHKIGRYEGLLSSHLRNRFGSRIRDDISVPLWNLRDSKGYSLRPDLTFHDSTTKLTIAIEVDEPYVLETGEPIHFVGADEARSASFLSLGWLVVRFSERQVVQNLEQCGELLHAIVGTVHEEGLIDPYEILQHYFPSHMRDAQWTKDQAQSMAFNAYRETYSK